MTAQPVGEFTIKNADITDMPYIMALQRANRESVGGLPPRPFEEGISSKTLSLSILNNDPCGYLLYSTIRGVLRIHQACIQYDARRRTYGEALWLSVITQHPAITEARLRCAADVEANLFWREMGFTCVNTVHGGTRRGRMINCWQQWFTNDGLISINDVAVTPMALLRRDTKGYYDQQTGFLTTPPHGFNTCEFSAATNGWQQKRGRPEPQSEQGCLF